MKHPLVIAVLLLASCASPSADLASGTVITVDDYPVKVAWQEGRRFAASGGGEPSDRWTTYRQKRAVEVLSGCRVDEVVSRPGARLLVAIVNCSSPRRTLVAR